jgi:hypothetical protein
VPRPHFYFERGDQHWLTLVFGIGWEGIILAVGPWCFGIEFHG